MCSAESTNARRCLQVACVQVLFDEVEKAHPDVMNLLLGVLDDGRCVVLGGAGWCRVVQGGARWCRVVQGGGRAGLCARRGGWRHFGCMPACLANLRIERLTASPPPATAPPPPAPCRLTDSKGRTVSFNNTLIILTSNLGAAARLELGDTPAGRAAVMDAVRRHFRPELLNRIDEVVEFQPLQPAQLREVARLQAGELDARLRERCSISLELTEAALDYAVAQAYDPVYGARPLRRWLERGAGGGLGVLSG